MKTLKISDSLSLPLDWIQLATVVYGSRGAGKTSLGRVAAEESFRQGQRFCAIDLKGDWHGLGSSADGRSEGIPVVVFGGEHAHVPLEPDAGAFVGETVAGLAQSVVLDFELFSKGKQIRFLASFFETLYHHNREPLLLLLDEAQRYAPQKPGPDEARTLGAVQDLVKLGRKHGIGLVLFTQRGAGLSKEVSELCDMLVAFRTPGPLDQDRIKEWLDANTTKAQRDEVMGRLSGLATGTAVFASGHPELKTFGVYPVRRPWTFDSSATPKIGERRAEPKRLATPDLETLKTKMAAAIERAKADDPKELRKQIAERDKRIAELEKAKPAAPKVERVEVPINDPTTISALERARAVFQKLDGCAAELGGALGTAIEYAKMRRAPATAPGPQVRTNIERVGPSVVHRDPKPGNGESKLGRCELALLGVLLQRQGQRTTAAQLAILSGYSRTSSSFSNALGALRSRGLAAGGGDDIRITDDGLLAAPDVPELPTGKALLDHWCAQLGRCERILLQVLSGQSKPVTKFELADLSGYSVTSSSFSNGLGKLRTLELARGGGDAIRVSEELVG